MAFPPTCCAAGRISAPLNIWQPPSPAQIGVAKADLYPAFTISGAIGLKASDFKGIFNTRRFEGFINPSFSWNVLNYGRIQNNVRVQDAEFQETIEQYKNTVLNAYSEVETALVAFVRSKQQVVYLSRSRRGFKTRRR